MRVPFQLVRCCPDTQNLNSVHHFVSFLDQACDGSDDAKPIRAKDWAPPPGGGGGKAFQDCKLC
eukprot:111760-Amphidinium_carterae.1